MPKLAGIEYGERPAYIYFTEVKDKNGRHVESRLSFKPEQYWSIKSRRKNLDVTCRRMDTTSGRWERFPFHDMD